MIKITADIDNRSVRAEGHSGFDEKGKDIVCAAVSILIYTYATELLKLGIPTDITDDGDVFEIYPNCYKPQMLYAFEMVLSGLRLLERSYRDNIELEVLKIG